MSYCRVYHASYGLRPASCNSCVRRQNDVDFLSEKTHSRDSLHVSRFSSIQPGQHILPFASIYLKLYYDVLKGGCNGKHRPSIKIAKQEQSETDFFLV